MGYSIHWSKFAGNLDNQWVLCEAYAIETGAHEISEIAAELGSEEYSDEVLADTLKEASYILSIVYDMPGCGQA